jgi:hypothetical protein
MKVRRFAAVAALLAVTACGVQPTGVINAGEAPSIRDTRSSAPAGYVILYFLVDGRLTGMPRQVSGYVTAADALNQLLAGPTDEEVANGAQTLLPAASGARVSGFSIPAVTVPFPVHKLPQLAISQLACTTLAVVQPVDNPAPLISLIGTDGAAAELEKCIP